MSERYSSTFDYELTGGRNNAAELRDGEEIYTGSNNPYRRTDLESQKIGHQVALADAARPRLEKQPSPAELMVMQVEGISERLVDGLRAKATQADDILAGDE